MNEIFWEKSYKNPITTTFGKPSREVIEIAKKLSPGSKILDIGCGEGRHSVYLASLGFYVEAIDISENGIKKLNNLINKPYAIHARVCDIASYDSNDQFDLVIAHGVLQFIEKEERNKAIEKMKRLTKDGGFNIIAVFTDALELPEDLKPHLVGIFKEKEICDYYQDWDVENFESYTFSDEHENGLRHIHAINKAIFKKQI